MTVSNAQGTVTYRKSSGNAKITVTSNGTITIHKGLKAGTYRVKIIVRAAGNETYKAAKKSVTVTLKVNKAANTIKVSSRVKTIKFAKVKKAAVVVAPLTVSYAKGTKTFKITSWLKGKAKGTKYIRINSMTGKITAKKGTPKGIYQFKVKVTAKGNTNYKAKAITKTVTVKVS